MLDLNAHKYALAGTGVATYLLLVRLLRNNRINRLTKSLNYTDPKSLETMSFTDAEYLTRLMGKWEFPYMYKTALSFALFRTYAIPSISTLLVSTNQFADSVNAHRRYADTALLIGEVVASPLDSYRSATAIERINFLHGRHGDKISNDDLLYTLGLFMCQPAVFIDRYEWRRVTAMEKKALWVYWREFGLRLGISGIPDSFEGMMSWSVTYEQTYMVPDQANHTVAEKTTDILTYFVPQFLRGVVRNLVIAVLDTRLRVAMLYDPPPRSSYVLLNTLLSARRFILKHLMLPRMTPFTSISEEPVASYAHLPEDQRRYYMQESMWASHPWYIRDSLWNQYGPWALMCRLSGWPLPSKQLKGDVGYKISEVGPRGLEKVGPQNEFERRKMNGDDNGHANGAVKGNGCPIAFH